MLNKYFLSFTEVNKVFQYWNEKQCLNFPDREKSLPEKIDLQGLIQKIFGLCYDFQI